MGAIWYLTKLKKLLPVSANEIISQIPLGI